MIKNHYETTERYCLIATDDYNRVTENIHEKILKYVSVGLIVESEDNLDIFIEEAYQRGDTAPAWRYLTRAQQLSTAYFQSALSDAKEFMMDFDDIVLPIMGEEEDRYLTTKIDAAGWLNAFSLAIIMRNVKAIGILSQVTDEFFNVGRRSSDNFDIQLVSLYKAMFNPAANFAEQLVIATASFMPDELTDDRFKYVSRISWPQLSIIQAIFTPDAEEKFNEAMEVALKRHKEFWKQHPEETKGVIPLPLTALAVIAYDHKGYKLTVKNGYILDWLISAENAPSNKAEKNTSPQSHTIESTDLTKIPSHVLSALKENDESKLESLREQRHSQYLPALIALYEAAEDWDLKGSIVVLLMDRKDSTDDILIPLMNDALNSPYHYTRGFALIWLYNDLSFYDQILEDSVMDEKKIDILLKKYLATQV